MITVAFEGGEGSGKDTVVADLKKHLEDKGLKVLVVREPGGCDVAEKLREILLHNEMSGEAEFLLLMASRVQLHKDIEHKLDGVDVLIKNRCFASSIVYQGVVKNVGVGRCKDVIDRFRLDLDPIDATILMDVDAEVGLQRAGTRSETDRFEQSGLEFHKKVNGTYRKLFTELREEFKSLLGDMYVVDANKSLEEVKDKTFKLVDGMLE